jgi:predicted outer membrane repeat protein
MIPRLSISLAALLAIACADEQALHTDASPLDPTGDAGPLDPTGDAGPIDPTGDAGLDPTGDAGPVDPMGDGGVFPADGGSRPDAAPADAVLAVCANGTAAHASIQAAVDAAPDGAHLVLCPGVHSGDVLISGKRLTVEGTGATLQNATLAVAGGAHVTIQGLGFRGGDPAARCTGAALTLTGSTVEDGGGLLADGCTLEIHGGAFLRHSGNEGGALHIVGGSFLIEGTRFEANHAATWGGAAYVSGDGTFRDVVFSGNTSDNKAGAVYVQGFAPVFERVRVVGNHAVADGGGIGTHESSPRFLDCDFEDNVSDDDGGGLRLHISSAHVERSRFRRNRAAGGDGGGLKVSHGASLIVDSIFEGNYSISAGGGIEVDDDNSELSRLTFTGNQAKRGGGIHGGSLGATRGWHDLTLTDNVAETYGGGIFIEENEGGTAMTRVRLSGNSAARGGGVAVRTTVKFSLENVLVTSGSADVTGAAFYFGDGATGTVRFVTVAGAEAPDGAAMRVQAATVTVTSSAFVGDISVDTATPGWRWNDTWQGSFSGMADPTGTDGNLAVDPLLAADGRLSGTSPLIDAGEPELMDLDGSRADMGAFGGGGL